MVLHGHQYARHFTFTAIYDAQALRFYRRCTWPPAIYIEYCYRAALIFSCCLFTAMPHYISDGAHHWLLLLPAMSYRPQYGYYLYIQQLLAALLLAFLPSDFYSDITRLVSCRRRHARYLCHAYFIAVCPAECETLL